MPRSNVKKVLLKAVPAGLGLVYLIWLVLGVLRFHPLAPLEETPDPLEITGVFHVHSTHSDGRKTPMAIAETAQDAGLDFVILTDHGSPNHDSLAARGWKSDILLLAGTEMSSNRGHLVGFGFPPSIESLPREAGLADPLIRSLGGFTVIAHPYSKTGWSWGGGIQARGLEIINADTMLRKNFPGMLPWLPALPFRPTLPLLKLLSPPEKNLAKWDALNRTSHVYGFYSTDAHMLYRSLFGLLRLHVLLEAPLSDDFAEAESQVFTALGAGRFFNAVDGAAPGDGFRFWAESPDGLVPMGGRTPFRSGITLHLRTPDIRPLRVRILRDGRVYRETSDPLPQLPAERGGVYRIEVFLKKGSPLNRRTPWILSNPIFLEDKNHEHHR